MDDTHRNLERKNETGFRILFYLNLVRNLEYIEYWKEEMG